MTFSTRRGRPKKATPSKDLGTTELQQKRMNQLTAEPLDLCLEKGVLSEQQHWCGVHLRWLYTLRYGAPSVSCRDIREEAHGIIRADDPEWRAEREYEYHEAVALLRQYGHYEKVMNVAVFHELPCFFNQTLIKRSLNNSMIRERLGAEHHALTNGFRALESLWCNYKNTQNRGESITTKHFYEATMETKSISPLVH